MSYALYQDPMQGQPMVIPKDSGIGVQLTPEHWSLYDPVLLRHMLATMNTLRNLFHVYLCWRQIRLCTTYDEPPPELANVMSIEQFETAKIEEMYTAEYKMVEYIFDAILSCMELYFCILPAIWRLIINTYSIVDDLIWQSIAFVAAFSGYMVLRRLPEILYSRFFLAPWYDPRQEKSLPLVGLLCSFPLLFVILQLGLVPLTAIFLEIEKTGKTWFWLWIWSLLILLSAIALIAFCVFGLPLLGAKVKDPAAVADLQHILKDVLKTFGFRPESIHIVRTFHSMSATAYVWGCCFYKRVYIMKTLIFNQGKPASELLHPDEVGKGLQNNQLVAYIAHEMCHWRQVHVLQAFIVIHTTLLIYFLIFGTVYRQTVLYEASGFHPIYFPPIVGYWLVYKYVMPLYLTITNWINLYFLRYLKYAADKKTWEMGYGPVFVDALVKLFGDNPTYPYVDKLYLMWHRYRPTTLMRIRRIKRLERKSKLTTSSTV
ncbi:CAAX prenyl protease 1 homolog [Drosophila hydei]|uniref:CAAX prenyl protease 1 homolog n=1 Tax=Drosophila hydei TaxID=7224 RepID=A0A6J1LJU7_DROHY|nr:CAAX prenyl protease 1 homolog [Drosophila hydei]